MRKNLRLTRGAFGFLIKRYAAILRKCGLAAVIGLFFAQPALGADDIPPPGSSFSVQSDMIFRDLGDISYGTIKGGHQHTLTLENTSLSAAEIDLESIRLKADNASFSSASVLRINETDLANARLSSRDNLVLSGPLNSVSGDNVLVSTGKDIYLGYGVNQSPDSTLTLNAGSEVTGKSIHANNINSDYVTFFDASSLQNGTLINNNTHGFSQFLGDATLESMHSKIGILLAYGKFDVVGGKFTAATASFADSATFNDVETGIDTITAQQLSHTGGSLSIGSNEANKINGDLTLTDTAASIAALKVSGKTAVSGGTFNAGSLDLAETVFSNVHPRIDSLNLRGPLSLLNGSSLFTTAQAIGQNDVTIAASELNLDGSYTAANLNLSDGTLNVSGDLHISSPSFELKNSKLSAANTFLDDLVSTGASSISAAESIKLGNVELASGSLSLESAAANGLISGGSLRIQAGSAASLLSGKTEFDGISGSGSLTAGNLILGGDLSLSAGTLKLSGQNVVGGDLALDSISGSLGHITVDGLTTLANVAATGEAAFIKDLRSTGQSALQMSGDIQTGNIEVASGSLSLQSSAVAGAISGGSVCIQPGAAASLLSDKTAFNDISGSGSLTAHNLVLKEDLNLGQGQLKLTGRNIVGGNLALDNVMGSLGDIMTSGTTALRDATLGAGAVSLRDVVSSGDSAIAGGGDMSLGNVAVNSGRLILDVIANSSALSGETLYIQNGAIASVRSANTTFNNIHGSGFLDAHNLNVRQNLNLENGSLSLSGANTIGGDMNLTSVGVSVNDLEVRGATDLKASFVTGRNITLGKGAALDGSSVLEGHVVTTGGDIVLANSAELLAETINLGSSHLVLEGAQGGRVIAAVGNFGSGDVTVDTNSMLSIGSTLPDWVNMGMDGHRASAALGLWTSFELASGANMDIGAGSLARRRAAGGNQINFTSDSLLITNASVASKDGRGAISARSSADANIASGAKLHILHAREDGLYRVLGENIKVNYDGDAWQGDNVRTDSALIKLERLEGDKLGWFQARKPGSGETLPPLTPDFGPVVDKPGVDLKPETPPTVTPTPPVVNPPANPPTVTPTPPVVIPPVTPPVTPPVNPPTPPDNTPGTPEQPGDPDTPVNPGQPETPGLPDNPNQPGNPDAPDNPDQPDNPGEPGSPGTPDNPNQPGNPGTPDNPGAPDNPNQPDNPGTPDNPDTPDDPAQPDNPENPYEPGNPDEPDSPDNPDTPAEPDFQPVTFQTAGQKFLSRAVNFWFIGHDARLAAKTIESAGRIFALGAVPELTLAANQAGINAMLARTGAGASAGSHAVNAKGELLADDPGAWHGFALWITPLYKSVNGYGLASGYWKTDVNGGLGGVALGADYTFANNLRAGLSFNIGGGYAHGNGELADTTNNMSFWGVGAYAGWSWNNFDLAADVAFTSTYNKLEQELHPDMQMEDLKSDITAWALSAGFEAGWTLPTKYVDIRPHAGIHYTHLHNDPYDVNSEGTVLEGRENSIDVWTFPLGLSFRKQFEFSNGWHLRPMLDLAVVPAAGDKKSKTKVRFTGTEPWVTTRDQFMDDITWRGNLGVEFGSDNLEFGLNYSVQAGLKTNSQMVMGTFVYSF